MSAQGNTRERQMRLRLAQEAARILTESGNRDYLQAKRKAADRLGAADTRNLPSNTEVEQALQEYQRLFQADSQPRALHMLRKTAKQAMHFLRDFKPRLVGPVLYGTADANSPVTLHIFCASPEDLLLFLHHHKIPHQLGERRLRMRNETQQAFPLCQFLADEVHIELVIFPLNQRHHAPLSALDGKPMRRADLDAVTRLLGSDEERGTRDGGF